MNTEILDLTSANLAEEVKNLFGELFEDDIYYDNIRRVGENVEIDIENGNSFACTITLLNVSLMQKENDYSIQFSMKVVVVILVKNVK